MGKSRAKKRSILEGIDSLFDNWLGIAGNPSYGQTPFASKTAAIDLSENGGRFMRAVDGEQPGPTLVERVLECINHNYSAAGSPLPSASNWKLTKAIEIDMANDSEEKVLEKTIAQLYGSEWANQVSTCNPMALAKEYARRIDLAHRVADYEYELIELKYGKTAGLQNGDRSGADNPLYAALELLEYGLLYLFCREKRLYKRQSGKSNLLSAKKIHLIVLAPPGYYTYVDTKRRKQSFHLRWLENSINCELAHYHQKRPKLPEMDFRFQCLSNEFDSAYRALLERIKQFRQIEGQMRREYDPDHE